MSVLGDLTDQSLVHECKRQLLLLTASRNTRLVLELVRCGGCPPAHPPHTCWVLSSGWSSDGM